jgi:hypothetical protein
MTVDGGERLTAEGIPQRFGNGKDGGIRADPATRFFVLSRFGVRIGSERFGKVWTGPEQASHEGRKGREVLDEGQRDKGTRWPRDLKRRSRAERRPSEVRTATVRTVDKCR